MQRETKNGRTVRTFTTSSPAQTIAMAARIARVLEPGDLIALEGGVGAGKTVFAKGVAKGLGVADYLYVNSPSFVIVKEYSGRLDLYHFDVFRLDQQEFTDTLDYRRYFYGRGVTVVEWADKIKDMLPEKYLDIRVTHVSHVKRRFDFTPYGGGYSRVIDGL